MDADTTLDDGFLEAAVAADDRRPRPDGRRRALLRRGGQRAARPVPAQRVHPLRPRDPTSPWPGLRAHRHRLALPAPARCEPLRPSRGALSRGPGDVYDTAALTEDNELTIALKSLGALMISPAAVHRGHRGDAHVAGPVGPAAALAARRAGEPRRLRRHPQTLRYWAQQLGIGYGVIALSTYLLLILLMVLSLDAVGVVPVLARASGWSSRWSAWSRCGGAAGARDCWRHVVPRAGLRAVPQRDLRQGRSSTSPWAARPRGSTSCTRVRLHALG